MPAACSRCRLQADAAGGARYERVRLHRARPGFRAAAAEKAANKAAGSWRRCRRRYKLTRWNWHRPVHGAFPRVRVAASVWDGGRGRTQPRTASTGRASSQQVWPALPTESEHAPAAAKPPRRRERRRRRRPCSAGALPRPVRSPDRVAAAVSRPESLPVLSRHRSRRPRPFLPAPQPCRPGRPCPKPYPARRFLRHSCPLQWFPTGPAWAPPGRVSVRPAGCW